LYFKNLITSQKNFVVKDLFHFILPTLFILESRFSIVEFVFNTDRRYILLYIFILYIVFYDFLIFFKLNKNIWHKKGSLEIVIKQNSLIKKWSIYLYTALNLILIRLIISLFLEKKLDDFISGQYAIWLTSIVWVVIFIKILSSPEILYGYSLLHKKSKENKNYITTNISHWKVISKAKITNVQDLQLNAKINQNIAKYIEEIENSSDNNNYFRNSKFSLTDFALKLNIPKSHMTYLFKYHSKISFSDYKKIARIEDALRLIQADYLKSNTFDSLAKEVGFSSYNPFFTSFKDIVGKPPQEYCATLTGLI
jgi:AraC-like DNA-binding protein